MVRSLFVLVVLSTFALAGCSGVSQSSCETIAALSAETARFICNSLTATTAQIQRGEVSDAQRAEILERVSILREYLGSQERTSEQLAVYFRRLGDQERARDQDLRAEILRNLVSQADEITRLTRE